MERLPLQPDSNIRPQDQQAGAKRTEFAGFIICETNYDISTCTDHSDLRFAKNLLGTLEIIIYFILFYSLFFIFIFLTAAVLDAPICVNLNEFHTKMILTTLLKGSRSSHFKPWFDRFKI